MLSSYFRFINGNYFREGFLAGIIWILLNYVLDLMVLVPMAGMSFGQYFMTIGLGYLQIPVVCTAVGMILQRKLLTNQL
jgi:hypothetical protein